MLQYPNSNFFMCGGLWGKIKNSTLLFENDVSSITSFQLSSVFNYSAARHVHICRHAHPVCVTRNLGAFAEMKSLQYICYSVFQYIIRFVQLACQPTSQQCFSLIVNQYQPLANNTFLLQQISTRYQPQPGKKSGAFACKFQVNRFSFHKCFLIKK